MKNRTILPLLLILLLISISAISASDVTNGTDTLSSVDDSNQISTIEEDANVPTSTEGEVVDSDLPDPCSSKVEDISCSTSIDEGVVENASLNEVTNGEIIPINDLKASYSLEVTNPTIVNQNKFISTNMAAGSSKNTFGVYLFGVNMNSVNLAKLKSYHIGNIFLNFYAYDTYGKSKVESFIKKANSYGIQVHIWMQVYYDGQWHNPATASSSYINSKINEAVKYAKLRNVAGIHLDYLRFAGSGSLRASKYSNGVSAINSLVQKIVKKVKAIDKNILVSAALMPEKGDSITYYGQNSAQLGKYLDILVPMAYKGNYAASSSWIKSVAQYYAKHSAKAQVWIALQSYKSDSDTTKLSASALKTDAQNAINGGAQGVVFFRYALSNLFDVSSISGVKEKSTTGSSSASSKVAVTEILNASNTIRTYYAKNKKLPKTVKVGSLKCTMAQFLYYEALAISNLHNGKKSALSKIGSLKEPSSPNAGDKISNKKWSKSQYVDSATRTYKWIKQNGQGPNYSTTNMGRLNYNNLVEGFAAVLSYYKSYKNLPDYITITNKKPAVVPPKPVTSFTISQIITAANTVRAYYAKNKALPTSVKIGTKSVSMTRFLYYESLAIVNIKNNNLSNIPVMTRALSEPEDPFMGDQLEKKHLKMDGYVDSARRTYKYILEHKQGPNYSSTAVGKINFCDLTDAFSRILTYYGHHSELPASVVVTTSSGSPDTSSITKLAKSLTKGLTSNYAKAVKMFNWVRDNIKYSYYYNSQQGAAKTLKLRSGNCCDQSNLYVAMCRAVSLTIRYVHGYCHFSDGWYGHVWTEVKIKGKWYSADTISTRNNFGEINNWDTKTATIYARYDNLPF
ncbi:transglutaminase domain-containing protein [uncultured Methanobrevibacter sp.]|uniref:transglutaminase domain-containing protein n=1 Tax=uncultured Methanobrevibacter sp. TaxID=253161 RepID=UPI0025E97A9E|nr:transglutaminase domain-containing protein [uncultured Methanobrevibacter sp.]